MINTVTLRLCRLALAVVVLTVPACVILHVSAQGRPALPIAAPPVRASDDPANAYLLGVWHLALAAGRASCQQAQLTPEWRSLLARDVNWVERGMRAEAGCGSTERFAVVQSIELDLPRIEDVRHRLGEVRTDYERLATSSDCWRQPDDAHRLRTLSGPVFALGEATAATSCAIATWHAALPEADARAVVRAIERARTLAAHIDQPAVRNIFLSELEHVAAQVTNTPGEAIYLALTAVMNRVQTALGIVP